MKKNTFLLYGQAGLVFLLLAIMAWLPAAKTNTVEHVNNVLVKKKIIFIAGDCSHGPGEHEHNAGCRLLAEELNKNVGDQVEATVVQGWPSDTTLLEQASGIVMYMDGGDGHLALKHLKHLSALMKKG